MLPLRLPLARLQLLLWLLLPCMASLASGQTARYYCDTPGRDHIARPTDFFLYTRANGSQRYLPGSRCAFQAISQTPGALYFVQVVNISMPTANLTIQSGNRILLVIGAGQTATVPALTTNSSNLAVSFFADKAEDGAPAGIGAVLRVRVFVTCPPGWCPVGNYCFGNAGDEIALGRRKLSFADAQAACRAMRSNLLQLPPAGLPADAATMIGLYGKLNGTLGSDNWIGLTDFTREGQFNYYWLDGTRFDDLSVIGCDSSWFGNNRNCKIYERCGSLVSKFYRLQRVLVMNACTSERAYTCYMPRGGAGHFNTVPPYSIFSPGAWAWAIVIACLFGTGVAIGVAYGVMRLCHAARRRKGGKSPEPEVASGTVQEEKL